MDYVVAKRHQWRQLREAASNPPPSSSLLSNRNRVGKAKKEEEEAAEVEEERTGKAEVEGSCNDDEMEKMLSKLTAIVPPSSLPPDSSHSSEEETSESDEQNEEEGGSGPLDTLAIMRKRLEESVLEAESGPGNGSSLELKMEPSKSKEGNLERDTSAVDDEEGADATIRILPPTPTAHKEGLGNGSVGVTNFPNPLDSLNVGCSSSSMGQSLSSRSSGAEEEEEEELEGEGTDQGPIYSPASSHTSLDLKRVSVVLPRIYWKGEE